MLQTSSTPAADGTHTLPAAISRLPMPRELREEAGMLHTEAFRARYAPSSGPLRLGNWQCTDAELPASQLGPQARNYQATIALGDRIGTQTAAASGPVAALTTMLHDRGVAIEMLKFRQYQADGTTATYIRGTDGVHDEWAVGWSEDATQSALRALVNCANRLTQTGA